ncbi:hypothetical protein M23134_05988 [Microscilla marina ATCC 23134]|uniref:Uncharacterized protein n=1 Tax=Microscilla marina ATCC 23134 TaxID=313606 RepID=A1ZU02_MICM2|nr:hypothetical protein M23134_05988 [Microscilla marina ATCC 23134]
MLFSRRKNKKEYLKILKLALVFFYICLSTDKNRLTYPMFVA